MIETVWKRPGTPPLCAIGGHGFGAVGRPAFYVDGHAICAEHALEIANGVDNRSSDVRLADALKDQRKREVAEEERERVRRARGKRQPGFVYYIRMDDLIKIGYAADIGRRMRAYPPSAELLAAHPGTLELEKSIHRDFRAFLSRGREWFTPHRTLMDHIEQVKRRFGDVSQLAYEYRKVG